MINEIILYLSRFIYFYMVYYSFYVYQFTTRYNIFVILVFVVTTFILSNHLVCGDFAVYIILYPKPPVVFILLIFHNHPIKII